jgi:hypothetical protein
MDDYERVAIEDWTAIVSHLREFAEGGDISESGEGIEVTVGSATLLVTKDGRVAAGMPLHDFEEGGVEALYFDHDADAIRVESGDRSYEFRKP